MNFYVPFFTFTHPMKPILILYTYLVTLFLIGCGGNIRTITDPDAAYQYKKYAVGAGLLESKYAKTTDLEKQYDLAKKIAYTYKANNNREKTAYWLKKAIELKPELATGMEYGRALKAIEKYDDAIKHYEAVYLKNRNSEAYAEMEICKKAKEWLSVPGNIKVSNLVEVNTPFSDFSPVMYKNGLMVFSSSRADTKGSALNDWTGDKNSDLFLTQNNEVIPFNDSVNTTAYEGTCTFSSDFKDMFFTRCGAASDKINSYCAIYHTQLINDEWTSPEPMHLFADSINVGHPALSRDKKKLYFTAVHPNGFGGRDIYVVTKQGTLWSEPRNLGRFINTKGDEMFPTLDESNNLYFSSDRHYGIGGLDIYKAEMEEGSKSYSQVTNLQTPFNSSGDDFGLIFSKNNTTNPKDRVKQEGYFTSDRKGGKGKDDLYKFSISYYNNYELTIKVFEKSTPKDGTTQYNIPITNAEIVILQNGSGLYKKVLRSNDTGYATSLLNKESDYNITVQKKGYFTNTTTTTTKGIESNDDVLIKIYKEIELVPIIPEQDIVIHNIYYDLDKSTLRPESLLSLDTLVQFFKDNKNLIIEIGSHTDARGSDEYNLKLSQARAQSVIDYFQTKGIEHSQVKAKGYGESKLTNHCANDIECTEVEHQRNRRTTFKVIGEKKVLESEE
jgi:peptidoglycan-associated lipoprotein